MIPFRSDSRRDRPINDGAPAARLAPRPLDQSDWTCGKVTSSPLRFRVNCDPADLTRILDDIVQKGIRRGIPMRAEDVRVEPRLDRRIEQPTISTDMTLGRFDLAPSVPQSRGLTTSGFRGLAFDFSMSARNEGLLSSRSLTSVSLASVGSND